MIDMFAVQLGIATSAQLAILGMSKWQLEKAVADGTLARIRPGWFARPSAVPAALAAARAHGCIACFSALALRGVWVPERQRHHIRTTKRGIRGCLPYGRQPPVRSILDDLETAYRCVLRCGSPEDILVVTDSLLQKRLATLDELHTWMLDAPLRTRQLLKRANGGSESGTETMVRLRLLSLGIGVRIQIRVGHGFRVDLLIGDRLIIECDSRDHHTDSAAYEADRERDRRLLANGYIVVRLTYRQIHDDWAQIQEDILAIVRRRDHYFSRRNRT